MAAKRILIIVLVAALVLILGTALAVFLILKNEKEIAPSGNNTSEDVIRSLTAPFGGSVEVPKEVLDSLTAPESKPKTVPQNILDSLTAPQ